MKLLLILFLIPFSLSTAHAAPALNPQVLYSQLTADLLSNDEGGDCSLRSDVWAYELEKLTGTAPSKILLLYSRDEPSRHGWVFHIAPALQVGGLWQVIERANGIQTALTASDWMSAINGGAPCELQTSVPSSIMDFFNHHSGAYHEYDPDSQSGRCLAFIVGAEVSKPEEGFLNFKPQYDAHQKPSGLEKAVNSCASYSGRVRYGSEWKNGVRVKASAFRDETEKAKVACLREFCRFDKAQDSLSRSEN